MINASLKNSSFLVKAKMIKKISLTNSVTSANKNLEKFSKSLQKTNATLI